ncbi:hypothetical protein ACLOJK_031874 [Asimina triloba]
MEWMYIINGRGSGLLHSAFPRSPAVVSSVEDLFEFICEGPLIEKLGLTPDMVSSKIDRWLECGLYLSRLFGFNELNLTTAQKARFYHYYIPVYFWCENQISLHKSKFKDGDEIPPLVIGFSAPQGSGKTTLVFALEYLFRVTGRKPATLSIDDFYLTHEDQAKLRKENPGNALLEPPSWVDASASSMTDDMVENGMNMKVPRYDKVRRKQLLILLFYGISFLPLFLDGVYSDLKSAYSGKGDRANPSAWPVIEGPLDVVLFEGWMLGFKPLPNEAVKAVDPQLEVVNKNLDAYYDSWDKFIQAWIVIRIKDPNCVFEWRLQAEVAMRADGKPGMSDEEVLSFS